MPEDHYRDLVEQGLGLMCIHDLEGVILYINPAAARSLGYKVEEGVGRNLQRFLAPQSRRLYHAYIERLQNNRFDNGFMRLVAHDGSEQTWLYNNRLHERPGDSACVLGHAQNVTNLARAVTERTEDLQRSNERLHSEIRHRERIEQELLQARKMESLGVLAGGIAHDFNNILTVIAGNLALARMHTQAEAPLSEILDQAERACTRASALSLQLLTFAKGGAPLRRTASLAQIIKESSGLALHGSKSRLTLHLPRDLWQADVDPGQISQAIHNVVLNADQAMPDGGPIDVVAENTMLTETTLPLPPGRYIRVLIRDRGQGIAAEDLPRIFDPYFTTRTGAKGLGLATAYAIVNKHQGHITAESPNSQGTTVSIYLPASVTPLRARKESAGPQPGTGRILVMDDEELIRSLARNVLGHLGYEVECAADGSEAVELYQQALSDNRPFRAVVLDLTVPGGMGGLEALQKLREVDPHVKAIVSSGYSEDQAMSNFFEHGFQAVVAKPWTILELSETLNRVLGDPRRPS